MNLAIFIRSLYTGTGGAEKQALLLLKCLASEHNLHFIIFKGDQIDSRYHQIISELPVKAYFLKGNLLKRLLDLFLIFRRNRVYAVFSYLAVNNFWGAITGRIAGVKFIVGGIRSSRFSLQKLLLQRFIHNHLSDYTIFNNYVGFEKLTRAGFRKDKALVIPNGIIAECPLEQRNPGNTITIITVGRFVAAKDYPVAIDAIKYLLEEYNLKPYNIVYLIIGYGPLREQIMTRIQEYELEDRIKLIIRPDNLKSFYDRADIYLCTSAFEGLSNSILEAMMAGIPIVATDAGDNRKMIIEGVSGYIVDIKDPATTADRLYELVISPEKRKSFGIRSHEHCRENYSAEAFHRAYNAFLQILDEKK